jgi:hypothetical protein
VNQIIFYVVFSDHLQSDFQVNFINIDN